MKPEDCKVGMRVSYELGPGRRFAGRVLTRPWMLSGTWVTRLKIKGQATEVTVAPLDCIAPTLEPFP